jgi:hypothetical protein
MVYGEWWLSSIHLNLSTRYRRVVSFMPRPLFLRWNKMVMRNDRKEKSMEVKTEEEKRRKIGKLYERLREGKKFHRMCWFSSLSLSLSLSRDIYVVTGVWLACSACTSVLLKLPPHRTLELHCKGHGGCSWLWLPIVRGCALINLTLAGAAMSDGRLDPLWQAISTPHIARRTS